MTSTKPHKRLPGRPDQATHRPSVLVPDGFSSSRTFEGAREGYVFKMGVAGLGYYPDLIPKKKDSYLPPPENGRVTVLASKPTRRCHYDVLGITKEAADEDIKKAYHRRALELHPDRSSAGAAEAAAEFQELSAAYAVLSAPLERRSYDQHREAILVGLHGKALTDPAERSENDEPPEPPAIDLSAFLSPEAFDGFDAASARSFYAVYANVFDELAAEELDVHLCTRAPADDDRPPPPFGGASSEWATVSAFYVYWEAFRTCRTYASERRYGAQQLERANKQRRKTMERENARLTADARRRRDEGVHALCACVRRRDPRVAVHEQSLAAQQAARPTSRKVEERIRLLQIEIEAADASGAQDDAHDDEDEEESDGEDDNEGKGVACEGVACKGVACGTPSAAADEDDDTSSEAEEEEDEDALVRMMASMTKQRQAPRSVAADDNVEMHGLDASGDSGGGEALGLAPAANAGLPPATGAEGIPEPPSMGPVPVPDWHISARSRSKPALNPRRKERDPEAAAKAAEGIRMRRAEDGLLCKVCGQVFHSRKEVLKHIEKTGHVRDPSAAPGGLPDNMFFIPGDQSARVVKGQLRIE